MTGRVLVTGASGFIGAPLVRLLVDQGWAVVASSRKRPENDPGVADWIETDLLAEDPRRLTVAARADVLIHLAWIATPGVYAESLANLDWLHASAALSAAFLAGGGRRLVGVGTCLEHDCGDGGPSTLYAAAKHACRLAFQRQVVGVDGASLAWGRIFFLLGAEDHPSRFAPSLARRLAAGETAEISQGLVERDFIDVRDCAAALAALAGAEGLGAEGSGAIDIGTGRAWRLRDLAEAIAAQAGRPDLLRINPALDRAGEPQRLVADPEPLRLATGFAPLYSLERSIDDLLGQYRGASLP